MNTPEIFVESEFAPLRTVVLAQSEVAVSEKMFAGSDASFLPPDAAVKLVPGMNFAQSDPEGQKAWGEERDNFSAVLQKHGVEVLRPRKLTQAEKDATGANGYSNFFVRDPFFTIGNAVIEGSLRFLHRRQEVLPVRDIMRGRVYPATCVYVALPQPEVAASDDATLGGGPFLEGGDILVLNKTIFVGNSGLASNTNGVAWLRKFLGPQGYTVEEVRLRPDILHLDCALGLVRDGLMIVCEEALLDGIPAQLKEWARVSVSLQDSAQLATNGIPISPSVYVTDPAFERIGRELERHGIKVEYVDYKISRSFGGAFRCSTQPLLRRT
ncbi:dimethylarginine dimethylaminohydrolase family protein [Herbaspirillum sp. GCM10030257]|uniref:dimethylarginine dimethylaminohydrolase family protein n=1 Tax=Herbaspirillum sp. GCM10030257 TaxID=3273393 RepID=UPI00360A19B1